MTANLALAAPAADASAPLRFEAIENETVQRILQATRQHLGTEIAFVGRYVEGGQRELMHVDTDLDLPMGPGFREPREDSFCWHILEGRLPELIQDPADHPLIVQFCGSVSLGTSGILATLLQDWFQQVLVILL